MIDYAKIWQHLESLPWCTLVGIGRAGSDGFHSQLDSHPQVLTFVGFLFFHRFWENAETTQTLMKTDREFWATAGAKEYRAKLNALDIAYEFVGHFIAKFRTEYDYQERKDQLGEGMDQSIRVDIPKFMTHMAGFFEHRPVTSKNFLTAVYASYAMALGQDPLQKKIIFHHIHHVRRLPPYLADFPESKIIATNRDPRAALVSGVEHRRKLRPSVYTPGLSRAEVVRLIDQSLPLFAHGERFRVIRMEDLANEAVMREVCAWLGIDYHPCVMTSTWNGLRWWGDRISQARAAPGLTEQQFLKSIRTNKWEQSLSTAEKYVLDFILGPRLDSCGYDRKPRHFVPHAIGAFFAILLPMTYERPFWSPGYLGRCLLRLRLKKVLRVPYHYIWRVLYYYELYFRVIRGDRMALPCFGRMPSPNTTGYPGSLAQSRETAAGS